VINAEALQLAVFRLDILVAAAGKIAALDIGARQGVADPPLRIKIGREQLLLLRLREAEKGLSRRIGQGSADSDQGLKGVRWIDKDAGLRLQRLAEGFKSGRAEVGQPVAVRLCRLIDLCAGGVQGSGRGDSPLLALPGDAGHGQKQGHGQGDCHFLHISSFVNIPSIGVRQTGQQPACRLLVTI